MNSNDSEIEMLDVHLNQYHKLNPDTQYTHKFTYIIAFYDFVKLMIPSALGMFVRNLMDIVSWIFIGRMDNSDYIAGIGLGMFFTYVVFRSVAVGLGGGIHTLCSQAFGAK